MPLRLLKIPRTFEQDCKVQVWIGKFRLQLDRPLKKALGFLQAIFLFIKESKIVHGLNVFWIKLQSRLVASLSLSIATLFLKN